MQKFELTIIAEPNKTEPELQKVQKRVEELIEKHDGSIESVEILGKKKLSYPLRQQQYGFYVLFTFTLPEKKANSFEKTLNLEPEVLRFLLVRYEPFQKMKPRAEKEQQVKTEERATKFPTKPAPKRSTAVEEAQSPVAPTTTVSEKVTVAPPSPTPKEELTSTAKEEPQPKPETKEKPTTIASKELATPKTPTPSEPREKEKQTKTKLENLDEELEKILKDEIL